MSGPTPIANAPTDTVLVPATPMTPLMAGVPGPRALFHSSPPPTTTEIKNLFNAIKGLNRRMDAAAIIKEFEWHTKALKVKERIMPLTTPMVFAWIKEGSPYIQVFHSAAKFGGGIKARRVPGGFHRFRE